MSEQFDGWLEEQLRRQLSAISAAPADPEASRYHELRARRSPTMLIRSLLAATGAKVAVGGTVAVLAASTAAGVATHSANPVNWGHHVTQAVQDCKHDLAAGTHGIGSCVSAFATTHGDADGDHASDAHHDADKHDADKHHADKTEGKSDESNGHGDEGKSDTPHGTPHAAAGNSDAHHGAHAGAAPGHSDTHPTPPAHP